jgi:hypothetical protein
MWVWKSLNVKDFLRLQNSLTKSSCKRLDGLERPLYSSYGSGIGWYFVMVCTPIISLYCYRLLSQSRPTLSLSTDAISETTDFKHSFVFSLSHLPVAYEGLLSHFGDSLSTNPWISIRFLQLVQAINRAGHYTGLDAKSTQIRLLP